jgi:hypothetical protein
LLAHAQVFIFQGISDGVTIGGTPGAKIWGRPLAWIQAWVKLGAHVKFWGDSPSRSSRMQPDTHKYTQLLDPCIARDFYCHTVIGIFI